ncbi:MAG: hypothetical protein HOP13_05580 [Alphaproteobacteria bacterium]|nr:hypothetical protein [Alphaproteobacteria bacterium]
MCEFISLITDSPDIDRLKEALALRGREAIAMANPAIQRLLGPSERQFRTRANCDCGTSLGSSKRAPAPDLTKTIAAKIKSGWSKTKIDRWVADQQKVHDRPKPRDDSYEYWAQLIDSLLALPNTSTAGLIVHSYKGWVDHEEFPARRREISPGQDLAESLQRIQMDEMLVVRQDLSRKKKPA